jgi:hypothetical protein
MAAPTRNYGASDGDESANRRNQDTATREERDGLWSDQAGRQITTDRWIQREQIPDYDVTAENKKLRK